MRFVIIFLLSFFLLGTQAHADNAGAKAGTTQTAKCPGGTKEVSDGSDSGLTVCCPDAAVASSSQPPHGAGGGNSGASSGAQNMAKKNKAVMEEVNRQAAIVDGKNAQVAESVMDQVLNNCIAGIDSNILSSLSGLASGSIFQSIVGGLTSLANRAIENAKQAACNLVHDASRQAIDAAIEKATIRLPGGLGTIGANTNLLGYRVIGTTSIGNGSASTLRGKGNVSNIDGLTIFQRGAGVMIIPNSGTGMGTLGTVIDGVSTGRMNNNRIIDAAKDILIK